MSDLPVYAKNLATEKTISYILEPKCTAMMRECNLSHQGDVEALQLSILSRLTSGYSEKNLCDALAFFDLHTIVNFQSFDSEVQLKMLKLLIRYFK